MQGGDEPQAEKEPANGVGSAGRDQGADGCEAGDQEDLGAK
jgi:hypothetical protein